MPDVFILEVDGDRERALTKFEFQSIGSSFISYLGTFPSKEEIFEFVRAVWFDWLFEPQQVPWLLSHKMPPNG